MVGVPEKPTEVGPDSIGPFRIRGILGRGGMGVVYRGEHGETGAPVAIKTIDNAEGVILASIRREIVALGRLKHPGVVSIVASGVSGGLPWYAMDLLVGTTLRDYVRRGDQYPRPKAVRPNATPVVAPTITASLSPAVLDQEPNSRVHRSPPREANRQELLGLVARLCDPLSHLHGRGIVHRDLKPENIFVRADGSPVIVDLGISSRFGGLRGREELDEAGTKIMGTVAYMAPEQIRGDLVDARADLYALGCILYECVTGEPPFAGMEARAVLAAHLRKKPLPPSELMDGVSPAIDRLIMQLLEKQPHERLGYADDVARAISGALGVNPPVESPTASPYVYRPLLIGRENALRELHDAVQQLTLHQLGGLVWLGGESGVGKTRLAMEAVIEATRRDVCVVLSGCAALGVGAEAAGGNEPLQAFAPFLLAVADRCRQFGLHETERLIGSHGDLLAPYQNALADLQGVGPSPVRAPADAQEARARVLAAAMHALLSFAEARPLLLVIDDLQWADDLSLALLQRLTDADLHDAAVLVVATYRMDEASERLKKLVASPGRRIAVDRLSVEQVGSMVNGMLALREAQPPLVDYLHSQSSGNPFFVVEYLRAAIQERFLVRDRDGRWIRRTQDNLTAGSLVLPTTLVELMQGRLRDLEQPGHFLLEAAAVLGRQFDSELLLACAGVDAQSATDALETLRSKQVFEEGNNGELRFVHDGLRELAYGNIDTTRLRDLHAQAAVVIQARHEDGSIEPHLGELGMHHSKAGSKERAAHYFESAANWARLNYATEDAIRFYRLALAQTPRLAIDTATKDQTSRLHEAVGELLLFGPVSAEAREHLEAAIREDGNPRGLSRARRRRKLARALERQHLHAEAFVEYGIAEGDLGAPPANDAPEYWQEFVQIQVEAAWNLYFLGDVDALDALVSRVRPAIERFGNAAQRARFFTAIAQSLVRRKRFRVDETVLEFTQLALNAGLESTDLRERTVAMFAHAFPLMLAGRREAAEPLFADAIKGADRVGDSTLLTRVTAYFGVLMRQSGDVARTRTIAERALRMAEQTKMNDYIGVAHANLAWVAWRDGELDQVREHATTALEAWRRMPSVYVFSYQWLARAPYAAYLQRHGEPKAALEQLAFLLEEHQQAPPPALVAAIKRAVDEQEPQRARLVDTALSRSQEANYV